MLAFRFICTCALFETLLALRRSSRRDANEEGSLEAETPAFLPGVEQPVRVETITAPSAYSTTQVLAYVNQLAASAIAQPGCLRFDVMQQAVDTSYTTLTNIVWYFAVWQDDDSYENFIGASGEALSNFNIELESVDDVSRETTEYYLPPTMQTQLSPKDDTDPRILWFYGYLKDETLATRDILQTAFFKIAEPTRAETGNLRYDQMIPKSATDFFMSENIWYHDLPDAQNVHMGSSWMATFFNEAPVADWIQIPLKLHTSRSPSAPAPAPAGAFVQYWRVPDHAEIAAALPQCDFWTAEYLQRKVPDECCSASAWPASVGFASGGPDNRTIVDDDSGRTTRCYARERVPAPGTYIRNFFGCYQGILMAVEGCEPAGTSQGNGYPMTSASAASATAEDGDPVSCNCGLPGFNQGSGCYVAASSFMFGLAPDPTANFLQISGDCSSGQTK